MQIDADGSRKVVNMKTIDVWGIKNQNVMIPFDVNVAPIKDVAGIYGQMLGQLACELINLPTTYADWRKIPRLGRMKYLRKK